MKLSTMILIGAAAGAAYLYKKKLDDAKAAAAAAPPATAAMQAPPITDTTNTVTSIQRTVNDPGTNSDDPTLGDQSYGVTSSWSSAGRGSSGWGSNWGRYQ